MNSFLMWPKRDNKLAICLEYEGNVMRIIIFVASPGYVDPDRVMGTENVYLSGWSVYVTSDPRIVLCLHLVTGSEVLALTIKRCHRKSACHQGGGGSRGGGEVWLLGHELWNIADMGQVVDPLEVSKKFHGIQYSAQRAFSFLLNTFQ